LNPIIPVGVMSGIWAFLVFMIVKDQYTY
jgi:hypothetical protein